MVFRAFSVKRQWAPGQALPFAPPPGREFQLDPDNPAHLFRSGPHIIPFSTKANAAALSPRLILVTARSPMRLKFSGGIEHHSYVVLLLCRRDLSRLAFVCDCGRNSPFTNALRDWPDEVLENLSI